MIIYFKIKLNLKNLIKLYLLINHKIYRVINLYKAIIHIINLNLKKILDKNIFHKLYKALNVHH